MSTTQIKNGFQGGSDDQAIVHTDGSLDVNVIGGNIVVTGSVITTPAGFSTISPGYPTQKSVGMASTELLPINASRKYAHIVNNTAYTVYLQYNVAAALNQGVRLNPGSIYFINGDDLWLGAVNAIAMLANQFVDVLEGV